VTFDGQNNGSQEEPRRGAQDNSQDGSKGRASSTAQGGKKGTSNNVAASAASLSHGRPAVLPPSSAPIAKMDVVSRNSFQIGLVTKEMSNPGDLDDIFVLAPPSTTFQRDRLRDRSRSYRRGHPAQTCLVSLALAYKRAERLYAFLKQARDTRDTVNAESRCVTNDGDVGSDLRTLTGSQSSDFAMDLLEDSSANH
jgi:hypothetical protein